MLRQIVECVPNFSEGRDATVVARIAQAIAQVPGAAVLGQTSDCDHNRSVITFAGAPAAVAEAAFRGIESAVALIDMNRHDGVHPRVGAADVVPLVPISGVTMEDCVRLAEQLGERVCRELRVPVYLYEAAARRPERVNLATGDAEIARRIARKVRFSSGGLPCVKALGFFLKSRGLAQVSINLTDYEVTPLCTVIEAVKAEAGGAGVGISGMELIGLIPRKALETAGGCNVQFENFHDGLVVENRLEQLL